MTLKFFENFQKLIPHCFIIVIASFKSTFSVEFEKRFEPC